MVSLVTEIFIIARAYVCHAVYIPEEANKKYKQSNTLYCNKGHLTDSNRCNIAHSSLISENAGSFSTSGVSGFLTDAMNCS